MSVKSRLKQYCEHRKLSIGGFCREARISNSYFSNVKGEMGLVIRAKIKDAFDDLNIDWLITGEGEMLNPPPIKESIITPYPNITTGDVVGHGNAFVAGNGNTVNTSADVVVAEVTPSGEVVAIEQPPLVPDKVVRDPNIEVLDWVNNPDTDHSRNAFNIVSIIKRTKCVIQMNNNAMSPTLYQNEYVFLKPFAPEIEIIDGEIYGIETRTRGVIIRFLYDEGDFYLSRPKNKREYGDIRIPKSEVINLYEIVFHGSTHLSSLPDNEGEMVKQLDQQDKYISSLIDQVGASMGEIIKQNKRNDRLMEQNAELVRKIIEK